jgi:hypothetical protein
MAARGGWLHSGSSAGGEFVDDALLLFFAVGHLAPTGAVYLPDALAHKYPHADRERDGQLPPHSPELAAEVHSHMALRLPDHAV